MWKKPWSLKEGFVIDGCLLLFGLLLQLATGPVNWDAFEWPVNALVLAVFMLAVVTVFIVRRNNYFIHFLTTHRASLAAIIGAGALTLVMGLTRQKPGEGWLHDMLMFWPFVVAWAYIAFLLGLILLRRLGHMVRFSKRHPNGGKRPWLRDIAFLLNHGGLLTVLLCATLGSPDIQQLRIVTHVGETEYRALNDEQRVVELPMGVELQRFIYEAYPDGSPRRFASDVRLHTSKGRVYSGTVDVNHPLEFAGWKIYQYGYDTQAGANSQTSVLELVRDPWLPMVYAGIYMMLAGAVLLFFGRSYGAPGISDAELQRQREKREAKRRKDASKRHKEEEFFGEHHGEHHHHHHHHNRAEE